MGTEIATTNINNLQVMAEAITTSGLFSLKNKNQALTLLLLAESEGLHAMTAMKQYHILNGRPVLKSAEVLSRFQKAGGRIKYIASDDTKCEVEFSHEQAGSITIKWDIEKAKKAGIYDTNPVWKKYPSNMLRSRCITDGVTALFPSCLGGMMTESTAQDIPAPDAMPTIEGADIEDAEILEPAPSIDGLKLKLSNKLKELSFTAKEVKEFAVKFKLNEDTELLELLVNDKELLMEKVAEFENGDKQ